MRKLLNGYSLDSVLDHAAGLVTVSAGGGNDGETGKVFRCARSKCFLVEAFQHKSTNS